MRAGAPLQIRGCPWAVELPRAEGNPPGLSHKSLLCRQLPPRRIPQSCALLSRVLSLKKNRDKWEENTHTRRAGWVHVGTTSRCPLHPSRTWERPFLLQNNPRKTNILGAVSPPRRLPPAAPFAGIIFAPRLINGVVTRQISSPELLLPSPRAVGGGNAGFHSDALGFNQGFFPGRIDYGKCR